MILILLIDLISDVTSHHDDGADFAGGTVSTPSFPHLLFCVIMLLRDSQAYAAARISSTTRTPY